MDYIVKDPYISCVMSENGKHWQITTYERPEMVRTCSNISDNSDRFICSECGLTMMLADHIGYIMLDRKHAVKELSYCPKCGRKVIE